MIENLNRLDAEAVRYLEQGLDESLSVRLEKSFSKNSDRPCLIYQKGREIFQKTYQQFEEDLRFCMPALREQAADSDVIVCRGTNSYENLVHLFSAVLSGYSIFPLNKNTPQVSQERQLLKFSLNKLKTFVVNEEKPLISESKSQTSFKESNNKKALIYIPSSGTTGEPKIVQQSEYALIKNCEALIEHHQMKETTAILTPLPIFHVNALEFTVMCSLLAGGTIGLMQDADQFMFDRFFKAYPFDILSLVPPLMRSMTRMNQLDFPKNRPRYVVTAAAPLSTETLRLFYEKYKRPVIQGYGMSEAVNFSCVFPVDGEEELYQKFCLEEEFPSIGTELSCNKVSVVDEDGHRLLENEKGEICLAGSNLMTGYLGQTLQENNLSKDLSLRTGDIGFYRTYKNQKYFFICGRKKDMIKKGGESLSLREIDDCLAKFATESCDIICAAVQSEIYGEDFVVVTPTQLDLDQQEKIIAYLKAELGALYRPRSFVVVDSPLRSPSGKVLRPKF